MLKQAHQRHVTITPSAKGGKIRCVLLINGGWSPEAQNDYGWGPAVLPLLRKLIPEVITLRLEQPDFLSRLLRLQGKVDVAMLATLGAFGEDGRLQSTLDLLGMPYVGSGATASAICMNKFLTKCLLGQLGFPAVGGCCVQYNQPRPDFYTVSRQWGTSLVVKPVASGASLGLSVVHDQREFANACSVAARDGDFLIEPFITGEEYAIGVIDTENGPLALPVCQIILDGAEPCYGVTSKLSPHYSFPTDRQCQRAPQMRSIVRAVHAAVCSGFSRVDLKIDPQGRMHILEVNTLPGLLPFSVIPVSANCAGLDAKTLILRLLESAFLPKPLASAPPVVVSRKSGKSAAADGRHGRLRQERVAELYQ
jgi:D-alanine-D-alanine ligase